jgi:hypothetical protein
MAKNDGKKPAEGATFEPEAQYRVKLNKRVDLGKGKYLFPGEDNVVKGKVAQGFGDAIESAERI